MNVSVEQQPRTQSPPETRAPRLARGIELVGRFTDSGYKDPPFLVRRSDGQMVQMPELLYRLAEEIDGRSGYGEIAERLTQRIGRGVTPDAAQMLVEKKLFQLGVVTAPDGSQPKVRKLDPLLALKLRTAVVPSWLMRALTTLFVPLYWRPVLAAVLLTIAVVDVWFFGFHGVADSARAIVYEPILLLLVLGLLVVATAFHEIGHATAARYGGAEPGVMGVGIYIVWPAFYTDVTDTYRLGRGGRLRTDLGGVYFNGVFVLAIAGVYAFTRYEPLLILIVIQHLQVLQQFLPFLRLDGYYILSDLVGVPDMFARIKPTLKSALPGSKTEERAAELKPWVRVVTTAWIAMLIPIIGSVFGMMIFNLPRMFATAWDSLFLQFDRMSSGNDVALIVGGIQTIALLLPFGGMGYTLTRTAKRLTAGAWSWSDGAPLRRALVIVVGVSIAAAAGWVLLPNGEYRPIQQAERGRVQDGLRQFLAFPTGRPGLTRERQEELGGAPAVRDLPGPDDADSQQGRNDATRSGPAETHLGKNDWPFLPTDSTLEEPTDETSPDDTDTFWWTDPWADPGTGATTDPPIGTTSDTPPTTTEPGTTSTTRATTSSTEPPTTAPTETTAGTETTTTSDTTEPTGTTATTATTP